MIAYYIFAAFSFPSTFSRSFQIGNRKSICKTHVCKEKILHVSYKWHNGVWSLWCSDLYKD